ncbi:Homocysteine S-methyltransferase [Marinomonas spartinae]|uniref:Homocysteine S-methyltransferase n=1 Tax=Marinomonas spartinae TaxID=1792290 RepID=A0A1A8TQW7_9GAMM|nr:homocysteine S-methyltransferase family protein [Marinomonas spartinae]SBS31848.1 Homocysteine S-methyltransferase [Marinomonas spartinae]SBS36824.1 Homocysteine S-methyltransferase [Marinomonas spartinae]
MTDITILDGGMGRELERHGAPFKQPEWSALAMMEAPDIVKVIHKGYITSGARVITTNSYALVPFHIGEEVFKARAYELAELAGKKAREAADESGTPTKVAASIAPMFGSYRADLYQAERVEELATPLIKAQNDYVDIWLCETQSMIDEPTKIKAIVDKVDTEHKPFWVAFTLEDSKPTEEPLLRSGERVVEAVKAMEVIGVNAILFNCSQPEIIGEAIKLTKAILQNKAIQIGAYANAFPPQPKNATANESLNALRQDLTPPAYLQWAQQWIQDGATLIGGCCGIGPEHIQVLANELTV